MGRMSLRDRIQEGVFILDGAMGTQLFARGVEVGACSARLNVSSPDVVADIHTAYFEAGSDAVLTNTFSANRYALQRHGLADDVAAINQAAAELAGRAAGSDKYVLGDIGPTGEFLQPLGTLEPRDLESAFVDQAGALAAGGVDALMIETMTVLDEAAIAIDAAKSVAPDLPLFASMAFDRAGDDFRTMMGVDVAAAVSKMVAHGADVVGFNCGTATLDEYVELAEKLVAAANAAPENVLILAEPNAGKPELIDGQAVYRVTPEEFAAAVQKTNALGIKIIGGCCGTTPEHIKAVSEILEGAA